jgi:two-component system phosphate regulon sensor histidine kinase PhoR
LPLEPASGSSFENMGNEEFLSIIVPHQKGLIWREMIWFILGAILFTIIITTAFFITVRTLLKQKKLSEIKSDFINNMTHEFKTPLASILIASKYMAQHDDIVANKKLHTYSQIIIDQGIKLDHHLEKILHVAKSDANPDILQKTSFNMVACIKNVIEIIQLKYSEANINFIYFNADISITADAFHFTNMVHNFLDNAIKYCDKKPAIDINITYANNHIVLLIKDNGIGIAPKHLKHVFEKFYRVPSNKNGFGLGLYYVQKICMLHHFKITIASQINNGTTIKLLIATV